MKVLFVGHPSENPADGGGATFQQCPAPRLAALPDCQYLRPKIPGHQEVQYHVRKHDIDLVWFLSPYYETVPVPFVMTVWDLGHRMLPEFPEVSNAPGSWTWSGREALYSQVLPRAVRVIVGNSVGAEQVARCYGVSEDRINTIPLCVDAEALLSGPPGNATLDGLEPLKYLLYPANFWPHKNHITVIDALQILLENHAEAQDLKLVFTGADKGNLAYVQAHAAQTGLSDDVVFTGFVSIDTLRQLYRGAFACVYASLMGPDNLPPLEAMALDCPVICAQYPGAFEQLGDAALYFDPLSASQIAQRVIELMAPAPAEEPWNPGLRASLVRQGRRLVETRTPGRYVQWVWAVLGELAVTRRLWGTGYRHL